MQKIFIFIIFNTLTNYFFCKITITKLFNKNTNPSYFYNFCLANLEYFFKNNISFMSNMSRFQTNHDFIFSKLALQHFFYLKVFFKAKLK